MRMTLTVSVARMQLFQDLIKFYGLYFCSKPVLWGDKYTVTVGTEDMSRYQRFTDSWYRIDTPYVPPKKKRWWQTFFGWFP